MALHRALQRCTETPDGCWDWPGAKRGGYGRLGFDGKTYTLHRFVYECVTGREIRNTIDHLCRNRSCCNPEHLEDVPLAENIRRGDSTGKGWRAARTHCPRDHKYTEENTRVGRDGARKCRVCDRERKVERRQTDPDFLAREREIRRQAYRRSLL